eukprot:TRINITY_DN11851_c0_g1_i1.p1 TRINITY_DN11851_c0_g1~~TRINITY_DN11851_c0_g1_i1.p1  ORF type:complete len:109 (+),score=14.11 TRINITY_DN11851_c0_g1_i1:45-371(+)
MTFNSGSGDETPRTHWGSLVVHGSASRESTPDPSFLMPDATMSEQASAFCTGDDTSSAVPSGATSSGSSGLESGCGQVSGSGQGSGNGQGSGRGREIGRRQHGCNDRN